MGLLSMSCPLIFVCPSSFSSSMSWHSGCKRPRLEELAFSLGFTYDRENVHSALYDTVLMMQCFFKAREKYGLFQF